jgi:hypothetical protein
MGPSHSRSDQRRGFAHAWYEIMVIFDPDTEEHTGSAHAREAPKVITKGGGTVDNLDISQSCGQRRLVASGLKPEQASGGDSGVVDLVR